MATFLMPLGGPDHHDRWDALPEAERQKAYEGFAAFAKATQERGTIFAVVDIRPCVGVSIR